MAREIKFRVYDEHGCPARGPRMVYSESGLAGFFREYDGSDGLMQFTGLHDKNGKEIYEGDIVEYITSCDESPFMREVYATVMYADALAAFYLVDHTDGLEAALLHAFGASGETALVVAGNIHENPELLEPTDDKGGE